MPIHRTNNRAHAVDYTFSYEPFRREPHGRTSGLPSYLSENDLPGVQFLLLANDHRNIFTRIYVEIRSTAQLSAVDFRKQPRNGHYLSNSYRLADIGSGRLMLQLLAKRALASGGCGPWRRHTRTLSLTKRRHAPAQQRPFRALNQHGPQYLSCQSRNINDLKSSVPSLG